MLHRPSRAPSTKSSIYVKAAVVAFAAAAVASSALACGGGSSTSGGIGTVTRTPLVHRATAVACSGAEAGAPSPVPFTNDAGSSACQVNADCKGGRNGRCTRIGNGTNQCVYNACDSDSECSTTASGGTGGVCACNGGNGGNNVCLSGGCRLDSDCGAGGFCSPTLGSCGHYSTPEAYYCHTSDDECVDDKDCATDAAPRGYCAYEKTIGHWKCSTTECAG